MSLIYQFFEPGVLLTEKTKNGNDNLTFVCKSCTTRKGEEIKVRSEKGRLTLMYKNF